MNELYELAMLEQIEADELFEEKKKLKILKKKYKRNKKRKNKKNNTFEGVLVPAGWDQQENINKISLFTQDDEDILLKHNHGVQIFKHFLNKKVRVIGDVKSNSQNERTLFVTDIARIFDGPKLSAA